ncbi:unnamed protein product [Thelazia callipaeda]|uniref:C2H2-type domain-containing protein n=1 Tax=Thelazia callipaeda TaxID=103827 RepID=A0A0N5D7S7_THECL|nr:unnamed protein product [Thelazia callipaeda]
MEATQEDQSRSLEIDVVEQNEPGFDQIEGKKNFDDDDGCQNHNLCSDDVSVESCDSGQLVSIEEFQAQEALMSYQLNIEVSNSQLLQVVNDVNTEVTSSEGNNLTSESAASVQCICHRPISLIQCLACGSTFRGNVALLCQVHPRRINLMDLRFCANASCRSINLVEYDNDPL